MKILFKRLPAACCTHLTPTSTIPHLKISHPRVRTAAGAAAGAAVLANTGTLAVRTAAHGCAVYSVGQRRRCSASPPSFRYNNNNNTSRQQHQHHSNNYFSSHFSRNHHVSLYELARPAVGVGGDASRQIYRASSGGTGGGKPSSRWMSSAAGGGGDNGGGDRGGSDNDGGSDADGEEDITGEDDDEEQLAPHLDYLVPNGNNENVADGSMDNGDDGDGEGDDDGSGSIGGGDGDGDLAAAQVEENVKGLTAIAEQAMLGPPVVPDEWDELLVLPIDRNPMFPHFAKVLMVKDNQPLVNKLQKLVDSRQPWVGAFLRTDIRADENEGYLELTDDVSSLHNMGSFCQIVQLEEDSQSPGMWKVLIQGIRRVQITGVNGDEALLTAKVDNAINLDYDENDKRIDAYTREILSTLKDLMRLEPVCVTSVQRLCNVISIQA